MNLPFPKQKILCSLNIDLAYLEIDRHTGSQEYFYHFYYNTHGELQALISKFDKISIKYEILTNFTEVEDREHIVILILLPNELLYYLRRGFAQNVKAN
jgi:hypothetical protein